MKTITISDEDETLLHGVLDDAVYDIDIFLDQYFDADNHIIEDDPTTRKQIELDVVRKNALQNLDYRISNAR
jgi:hypothetical protein